MVVIKLENVNKIFDPDVHVLKNIDLEIKEIRNFIKYNICGLKKKNISV